MKRIYLISTFVLGTSLGLLSCSDYLDMTPTNEASDKLVWSSVSKAELVVNSFYHYTAYFGNYNEGQCKAGMTEGLTDLIKYGDANYNAYRYVPNELSYGESSVLTANYVSVYLGNWSTVYEYVRRVNEALYNLDKYGSFSSEETLRLESELRFFRGMLYFDLVKRYKEVIIYDKDMSKIQANTALSTESQGWDFVEADLNYAGEHLQKNVQANGRVTSGAAYALLSRAMLYAERWDKAKAAAEEVFSMKLYSLTGNYADAFKSNSSEAIWEYDYNATNKVYHSWDNFYAPGGDKTLDGNGQVSGLATPTQEMVESYEYAKVGGFPDWSKWHTLTGTEEMPPYTQLEPRFQAAVLYNGSTWKNRTIESYVGGVDGWCTWKVEKDANGRTTTGYFLKKLVDETHHFTTSQYCESPWIAIRYAEVLLNYAEACCKTSDPTNANKAIKEIRNRVGLPYSDKSGDALMAAIRQERKVEFSCEGLYYWDMRRWKLSKDAFTGTRRHGLKIEKNANGTFKYTYVEVDDKDLNFPAKMYQCPLPSDEINGNKLVNQYTEWQ
nr:RagB/SusD family nutrient uptake outer membrane protein [uncultured Bacteroides sp.]